MYAKAGQMFNSAHSRLYLQCISNMIRLALEKKDLQGEHIKNVSTAPPFIDLWQIGMHVAHQMHMEIM